MKKLYSLSKNGKEVVSVEIDIPLLLPIQTRLDRTWLRGVIASQVTSAVSKHKPKGVRNSQPAPAKKIRARV